MAVVYNAWLRWFGCAQLVLGLCLYALLTNLASRRKERNAFVATVLTAKTTLEDEEEEEGHARREHTSSPEERHSVGWDIESQDDVAVKNGAEDSKELATVTIIDNLCLVGSTSSLVLPDGQEHSLVWLTPGNTKNSTPRSSFQSAQQSMGESNPAQTFKQERTWI